MKGGAFCGDEKNSPSSEGGCVGPGAPGACPPPPKWDARSGQLWFRGALLWERGRKIARLEEKLLAALEAADWQPVDDPLERDDRVSPELQLAETVRRVKRRQLVDWIDLHVTGLTVVWEDRVANGKAKD